MPRVTFMTEKGDTYAVDLTQEEYDKYFYDPQARYSIGKALATEEEEEL